MNLFKSVSVPCLAAALCVTLVAGCGKSKEQEAAEAAAAKMAEAAKKMGDALKSGAPQTPQDAMAAASTMIGAMMGGDLKGAAEPVDFRELRELLPASVGNLKRGEASGERAAAGHIKMAHAQARYGEANGPRLRMKITDTGSMSGIMGMASAAWAMTSIDRESDSGYEKTSTVDGHKMREEWNAKGKRGEVDMIVGGRFIIEIRGNGIEMKDLKQALNAIDLKKLQTLKSAPAAAAAK